MSYVSYRILSLSGRRSGLPVPRVCLKDGFLSTDDVEIPLPPVCGITQKGPDAPSQLTRIAKVSVHNGYFRMT